MNERVESVESVESAEQATPRGRSAALVRAVVDGRINEVRRLLGAGADPNATGPGVTTGTEDPLLLIALIRHRPMIALALLDAGADPDSRRTIGGQTALWWAASLGYRDVVDGLIRRGAGIDAGERHGPTPLVNACVAGEVEVVRMLLAAGADPSARVSDGRAVLDLAVRGGRPEILAMLLEAGADPNGHPGARPLISACIDGTTPMVRILLAAGADPDATTADRTTPLMWAVDRGLTETVELLLEAGADPHGCEPIDRRVAYRPGADRPRRALIGTLLRRHAARGRDTLRSPA